MVVGDVMALKCFLFNKLVRDKVRERCDARNIKFDYTCLGLNDHIEALKDKIVEEAQEIKLSTDKAELIKEIADVLEVIDVLIDKSQISLNEVLEEKQKKIDKRGSFCKGLYFNHIIIDDEHPFIDYYLKSKDKYPEIELKD